MAGTSVDLGADVLVERGVDAAAAELRDDVDALDPPDHAVAPVAPLVGDHQRSDDAVAALGHEVAAQGRGVEDAPERRA